MNSARPSRQRAPPRARADRAQRPRAAGPGRPAGRRQVDAGRRAAGRVREGRRRSCRWTASTWPTSNSSAWAGARARARPTPSTAPATSRCCAGCSCRPTTRSSTRPSSAARSRSRSPTRFPIFARTQLVITEGNYLLLDEGPWAEVQAACWTRSGTSTSTTRVRVTTRLTRPHATSSSAAARGVAAAWVAGTDEPNARLIEASRCRPRPSQGRRSRVLSSGKEGDARQLSPLHEARPCRQLRASRTVS